MKRYIMINAHCGYIWGDTSSLPPKDRTPVEAAYDIDYASDPSNTEGLAYVEEDFYDNSGNGCYVYLVPDGVDIPLVADGQDQATIELVTSTCKLVAHVIARDTETGAES